MSKKIRCPACKERFDLDYGLEVGDILDCPGCTVELRLIGLDPDEVEQVFDSLDDYGDDENEE